MKKKLRGIVMPRRNKVLPPQPTVTVEVTIPNQGNINATFDAGTSLTRALTDKARQVAAGMDLFEGNRDIEYECAPSAQNEVMAMITEFAPSGTIARVRGDG